MEIFMGIRDLGNGQWTNDSIPGEVYYNQYDALNAYKKAVAVLHQCQAVGKEVLRHTIRHHQALQHKWLTQNQSNHLQGWQL